MRTSYICVVLILVVGGCDNDAERQAEVSGAKVSESRPASAPTATTLPTVDAYLPPLTRGGLGGSERGEALPDKQDRTAAIETQPAEGVPAFQPLLDARVGEWAMYAGMDSRALRYEIAEVDGDTIRTQVIVYEQGKPLGQPATREDGREIDRLAKQASTQNTAWQVNRVRITLLGRDWDALLFEDRWTDEDIPYLRRTWVNADVPVFGLLRMEMHGDEILEARLELIGYGQSTDNR